MTRCVLLLLAALLLAGCQPDAALATGCCDAALAAGCCDAALAAGCCDAALATGCSGGDAAAATACYVPMGVQILAFVGLATLVLLALGLVLFMGGLVEWMREGYRYPGV